jgi:diadenosine tetraphosphate (Ap4A) HIT family hydrolase
MTSCDFKPCAKESKKRPGASCPRPPAICAPEAYYDPGFQLALAENRRQNRWIFDLIDTPNCPGETVHHDAQAWLLARDVHRGADSRYLVVFKDRALLSLRDLRAEHLAVLEDVVAFLRRWLPQQEPEHHAQYHLYFHYMPSVFQLHMHVSMRRAPESLRVHRVHHVIRNLRARATWYRDALILCQSTGALRT